jgi:hypothetical protein
VLPDAALNGPEPPIHRTSKPSTRPRLPGRFAALLVGALAALSTPGRADDPPQAEAPPGPLNPALLQALTPILADWIARSRDVAIQQGVAEIPAAIRGSLAGYVPEATLSRVRWRAGGGSEMSLQQNVFAFGHVPAVTLDFVVVFADEKAALEDPKLWAHELKHVMQFAEWGVGGFATRYLRDYEAVEKEAADYRWEFMKLRGLTPPPAPVR